MASIAPPAPDWGGVRTEFPVLADWTYLNSATLGPIPQRAVRASAAHLEERNRTPCVGFLSWFEQLDGLRARVAKLIGAGADDIAFMPSAGIGLSWILTGLDWRPGDRVLGLDHEFPNNLYAPFRLAERGVEFDRAAGGVEFDPDEFCSRLTERTRLVLVSAVNYANGLRPPLERIGEAARQVGALFVVDGTQAVGAAPIDVGRIGCDALLCHCYKWMLSPTGAGFLYVDRKAREQLSPAVSSWRSHREWREVDRLHHGPPELPESAARYEGGMLDFSALAALGAVLELYEELGASTIIARTGALAKRARQVVRDVGGEPLADRGRWFDSAVVAAELPGWDVSKLAVELQSKRIVVAARQGSLRISPHFFNDEDDLEILAAALRAFRR